MVGGLGRGEAVYGARGRLGCDDYFVGGYGGELRIGSVGACYERTDFFVVEIVFRALAGVVGNALGRTHFGWVGGGEGGVGREGAEWALLFRL